MIGLRLFLSGVLIAAGERIRPRCRAWSQASAGGARTLGQYMRGGTR